MLLESDGWSSNIQATWGGWYLQSGSIFMSLPPWLRDSLTVRIGNGWIGLGWEGRVELGPDPLLLGDWWTAACVTGCGEWEQGREPYIWLSGDLRAQPPDPRAKGIWKTFKKQQVLNLSFNLMDKLCFYEFCGRVLSKYKILQQMVLERLNMHRRRMRSGPSLTS